MLNWVYWLVLVTHAVECKATGRALSLLTDLSQYFFLGLTLVLRPLLSTSVSLARVSESSV